MNREQLLEIMRATATPKPTPVEVPKWGTVYVRSRTLEEVDSDADKETSAQEKDTKENRHRRLARAVAKVLCDENGARIFDSVEEDINLIAAQPYFILRKVLETAGGGDEDEGKFPAANS